MKCRCETCTHSKPPCAATPGTCGGNCSHEQISCRVRVNNPDDPYDFPPDSCKYYLPRIYRL